MAKLIRLEGFSKESDILVYLLDKLEDKSALADKIYQKAWDMIGAGRPKVASKLIEPLCCNFIKVNSDDFKEFVLEEVDSFMMVNDPKFLKTCAKIMSLGIVGELVGNPLSYKKYLSGEQLSEVEQMITERGKAKFLRMIKKGKKMNRVAKKLKAGRIKDADEIIGDFQKVNVELVAIDEKIEALERLKNKKIEDSQPLEDMYQLASTMRKDLGKVLVVLAKKGIKPNFSNDMRDFKNTYLSCSCFLKRAGNEFGLISYDLILRNYGDRESAFGATASNPELVVSFHSWNRDTQYSEEHENVAKNTLSEWRKFLKNAVKELLVAPQGNW